MQTFFAIATAVALSLAATEIAVGIVTRQPFTRLKLNLACYSAGQAAYWLACAFLLGWI